MHSLTPISFYLTSAHLTRTMTILLLTWNPCLKILVQLRVLSHFKLVILYMFGRGLWNLKRHNLNLSFVLPSIYLYIFHLRNDVCVGTASTCRNTISLMLTRNSCLQIVVQLRVLSQFYFQLRYNEIHNIAGTNYFITFL